MVFQLVDLEKILNALKYFDLVLDLQVIVGDLNLIHCNYIVILCEFYCDIVIFFRPEAIDTCDL